MIHAAVSQVGALSAEQLKQLDQKFDNRIDKL